MFVNLVLVLLWLTFTVYLFKIMLNKKAFTTYVFAIILWTIIHYQGELHMSTNGLISNVCTISSIFCLLILNAQALAKEIAYPRGKKFKSAGKLYKLLLEDFNSLKWCQWNYRFPKKLMICESSCFWEHMLVVDQLLLLRKRLSFGLSDCNIHK